MQCDHSFSKLDIFCLFIERILSVTLLSFSGIKNFTVVMLKDNSTESETNLGKPKDFLSVHQLIPHFMDEEGNWK